MKNCTYLFRTVLLVCVLSVMGKLYAQVPAPFTQEGINVSTGDFLGFLQYKPSDYNQQPNTKYPLIIFLHGIGERGNGTTQLRNVTCCGLPRIVKMGHKMNFTWNGKNESFVVIAPQCPKKYGMWPTEFVDELIKYAKQNLHIDPDRIFLTGLSMGGGGSLRYISNDAAYPKNLAACATICAPCTFYDGKVVAAAKLPVWSFHAEDDPTASVTCSERAYDRIMAANPEVKPILTLWPTGGHQVWDRVYTDTNYKYQGVVNIYEWFLGQNRKFAPNKLPVAHAGGNINITTGTGIATLNASGSTDADGKIVRYVWKKISGPAAGTITNAFGPNSSTTVTGLTIPGTYQYQVYAVDDRASFSSDVVTVTVAEGSVIPNVLPVAKAGNDIELLLPQNNTTLDGSNSSDEDGSIISYFWSKVSGPAVTISDPNKKSTGLLGMVAGTYVFKLKVIDDKGGSSEDLVTIVVKAQAPPVNQLPVARAGNDVTITLPNNKITLNANSSTDADGTINSYSWTKITGPTQYVIANPNSASTDLTKLVEGIYSFKLRVTDNKGGIDADTIIVTVNPAPPPANVPPVAQAGANKTITLPIDSVKLSGDQSADVDGTITNYTWSYISGPSAYNIKNANSVNTDITGLTEGTYSFRLLVKDNDGATDADTVVVIVNQAIVPPPPPNKAPVSKAGNDINITLPENSVTLNGSASTDVDGTITNYSWSKISGPKDFNIVSAFSSITDIDNLVEGTYYFSLQVKDNDGAIGKDTIRVIVNPAPNMIPDADAGSDIEVQLPNPTIQLNGRGSNDPDGTIALYDWIKVSGPTGVTITNSTTSTPGIVGVKEGEYMFRLTVTDNDGAVASDVVKVTVLPAVEAPIPANQAPVADAGPDVTVTFPETTAELYGDFSHDTDGVINNYSWRQIRGDSAAVIADSLLAVTNLSNLVTGDYVFELTVTDDNGNSSRDSVTVSVVNNLRYENQMAVYPNPARSDISIQLSSDTTGPVHIAVYNTTGILVKNFVSEKSGVQFQKSLNISEMKAGLYYVEVIIGNKQKMITRFIKQK